MRLALAICSYWFLSGIAYAESDANQFLRDYDAVTLAERRDMSENLSRIETGMSWVNVYMRIGKNDRFIVHQILWRQLGSN